MTHQFEQHQSFWIDSTEKTHFPSLNGDVTVDIAIVGGGIAGLTAAYFLTKAGKKVAVLEAKSIVTGVSGHTTAKLTSLHQLIYADLLKEIGEEKTRLYAQSNEAAIEQVAKIIEDEQIDCDFRRLANYTFALPQNDLSLIHKEVDAAQKVGLPASFVSETSLPFPVSGAIKLENQAEFHIRKYLLHLAQVIVSDGNSIFEQTKVHDVEEGQPCRVITDLGVVNAEKVLVTTHLPILNQGLFFAKAYAKRSYMIGAPIDPTQVPEGMFIGYGSNYHSIRTTPDGDGVLLIVGGEGHKVGEKNDTEKCYQALEEYAKSHFPIDTIKYRWSTQDFVSFDKLPYIGKLTPLSQHIYVATGFSLWGMTKGTLSGMILSDLVMNNPNPWADLYDSTRATPFVTQTGLKQNIEVGMHWVGDRIQTLFSSDSIADLQPDTGKVLSCDGEKVAVYKDKMGEVQAVSAVCSHLGCIVNWNNAEKSWDCPCHGARFDTDGKVLHAPAIKDLDRKNLAVRT